LDVGLRGDLRVSSAALMQPSAKGVLASTADKLLAPQFIISKFLNPSLHLNAFHSTSLPHTFERFTQTN
jgi:hypothetical protein